MTESTKVTMTLEDAIRTRRSVRGYLEKPVPKEIIDKAFALAQLSPSNSNIQPWHVFVASGKTRDTIREELIAQVKSGNFGAPEFDYPDRFDGVYRQRQVDCAVELYTQMGIARDDKVGRLTALLRNFELFDAPHMAFICMNKEFPQSVAVDVGIYAQTLILAFTALGVSTCAMGAMRYHPQVARKAFGFGEDLSVLFGIAFGYEDTSVLANNTRVDRAPVEECVVFRD